MVVGSYLPVDRDRLNSDPTLLLLPLFHKKMLKLVQVAMLLLLSGCVTDVRRSVWHDFAGGISAYGSYQPFAESASSVKYTHVRFGDLYSRYKVQPVKNISLIMEGRKFDLDKLNGNLMISMFESGSCSKDKLDNEKGAEWESCMGTFAWGRLEDGEVGFLEIYYYPLTDDTQPALVNRITNARFELPLTKEELFSLFGQPTKSERYFMH